jgi:hypothetical protein
MECFFLRRRLKKRDCPKVCWKYEISISTDDSLSVLVRLSHSDGLFCMFWTVNLDSNKKISLSTIFYGHLSYFVPNKVCDG